MSNMIDQQVQDVLELLNQKLHGNVEYALFSEVFDAVADIVVPEGYTLVPVDPTQKMIDKFPEVFYQDTYAGECSLWVDDEVIRSGYKAMLGEVE